MHIILHQPALERVIFSIINLPLSAKYKRTLKAKNLRYIADNDIIFPVSSFAEVVYEICKCK